jgi:tetratricopeptide (TPR) repeat protein
MTAERPTYKPTFFDRHGPDGGGYLRIYAYGLTVFAFLVIGGFLLIGQGPIKRTFGVFVAILVIAAAASGLVMGAALWLSKMAGATYGRLMVSGSTTPYQEQYSYQQALVMQGQIDEALASFEAVIVEQPDAVAPRMKAAELYARERGNSGRAAELFREIQRMDALTPGNDIYATNRLIDLLAGPLNDPGRALVELRRLIEKYPGSAAAEHARVALAALKARHNSSGDNNSNN